MGDLELEFFTPVATQEAEVLFKQAWSVAKLIHPNDQHKIIVEGLADALIGLGKVRRQLGQNDCNNSA